ncbi:alpha-amylase family protein [Oscillospiraceae bacterium MB08-C2-2]|nr:alpha-amylase family protein [Oscillospiraceae bacterium MB08-C2-2]
MAEKLWWQKQLRIIQYNLQSRDCALMDPEKIARETQEMGGDSVVINVAGGGVTYFPTVSKYHAINPFLPKGRDLLKDLIDAFHSRNIKVFARIEFTLMEESVYHQKPQWVSRLADGSPRLVGAERPGNWNLIYVACPAGGYQEEGLRIFREAMEKYDIDGVFWMGGYKMPCWCEDCRRKYREHYGTEMPLTTDTGEHWADWSNHISGEIAAKCFDLMKSIDPAKPIMRHFWPFDRMGHSDIPMYATDVQQSVKEGNMLVTEAQDILSLGTRNLPEWSTPALRMKVGRSVPDFAPPVGIIHACPGMDWRHACMGEAEFLYWAAQIPANGGSYWTTLTGFPDTVTDKRMLRAMTQLNNMMKSVAGDMDGAKSIAQVAVFSDGGINVQGWAEALFCGHIEFDMLIHSQMTFERIQGYKVVILPRGFAYPQGSKEILERYVAEGGRLIIEGTSGAALAPVQGLIGAQAESIIQSNPLESTYLRIEKEGQALQQIIGDSVYIPLRGTVGFHTPGEGVKTLVSWVPPFAPANVSGLPPERASLPADHTEVPMCTLREYQKGKIMFISYEASRLVAQYALRDMFDLVGGYVKLLLGEDRLFRFEGPQRVMLTAFEKEGDYLFHLINGIGQRPLQDTIPCHNLRIHLRLNGRKAVGVHSKIAGCKVEWEANQDILSITIPSLEVWDMLRVSLG